MRNIIFWMLISPIGLVAQNVGIGTTIPTLGRLQVHGAVGRTAAIFGSEYNLFSSNGAGIAVMKNDPAIGYNNYINYKNYVLYPGASLIQRLETATGSMVFETYPHRSVFDEIGSPLSRLTIRRNGNVSVNYTEGNASLLVVSPQAEGFTTARFKGTTYHSIFNQTNSLSALELQNTTINAGKYGGKVFINDIPMGNVLIGNTSSKVGINTASPEAVLSITQMGGLGLIIVSPVFAYHNWEMVSVKIANVDGSDMFMYYDENSYKGKFSFSNGAYTKVSDSRLKTDIRPLAPVMDKVMKLVPTEYEMIYDNPGHYKSIGFVAQDVKKLFPELVGLMPGANTGYRNIENLHSLNYEGFGVLAIKAIQEQQETLQLLNERIKTVKETITALKAAQAIAQ